MQIEPDREPVDRADDSVDEETLLRMFDEALDSLGEEVERQEERAEREPLRGGWVGSGN